MLRAHLAMGRAFESTDARRGAPPVALISYGLLQQQYGGAPDVLRKLIVVDRVPRTIVGVTPPGLDLPLLARGAARSSGFHSISIRFETQAWCSAVSNRVRHP